MEQLVIYHDREQINKMTMRQIVVGCACVLVGILLAFVIGGYIGAALIGATVGGGIALAGQGFYNRVKYTRQLENNTPIAVLNEEGILLKEPPYDYGLISWNDMDDVTVVRKPKTVSYICPVLKRPESFLYSLASNNHRQAKMIKRIVGSYGAFLVATAAQEPEEIAARARKFLEASRAAGAPAASESPVAAAAAAPTADAGQADAPAAE